ncbi:hypothetical protein PMAYCL1PPCAC_13476, partial [Pristionchus mayeri]
AGVALLCECGHECLSHQHSYSCSLANFSVVRKREGPIRTFADSKTTPKCVICVIYPKTVDGYTKHLRNHDQSTLLANGVFIQCSCGFEVHSNDYDRSHTKRAYFRYCVVVESTLFTIWMDRCLNSSKRRRIHKKLRVNEWKRRRNLRRKRKERHCQIIARLTLFTAMMAEISEGENGIHSLYRELCRRIEEVASIKMSFSQWKNLLRMFEKSEERLKEGNEFLDMKFHANQNMNVEVRKKEMRKVINGISARSILAKLAELKKKFVEWKEMRKRSGTRLVLLLLKR